MVEFNPVSNVKAEITAQQKGAVKQDEGIITISFKNGSPEKTEQKQADYNAYGKDFANFAKFKGNDKHDAMRMTNDAARDIKKAYMQLQHEMPGITLSFEEMPDPNKCGKKREGFFTYQQQLNDWKDIALQQIANAREKSTSDVVYNAAGAIMANDNKNAANTQAVTVATGAAAAETVIENQENNTKEVKKAVFGAAAGVKRQVQDSEENLHVHIENATEVTNENIDRVGYTVSDEADRIIYTVEEKSKDLTSQANRNKEEIKDHVSTEHKETRKTVDDKGNEVIDTLDPLGSKRAIKKGRDAVGRNAGTILGGIVAGPGGAIIGHEIDKKRKQPEKTE